MRYNKFSLFVVLILLICPRLKASEYQLSEDSLLQLIFEAKDAYGSDYRKSLGYIDSVSLLAKDLDYNEAVLECLINKAEIYRLLGRKDSFLLLIIKAKK